MNYSNIIDALLINIDFDLLSIEGAEWTFTNGFYTVIISEERVVLNTPNGNNADPRILLQYA